MSQKEDKSFTSDFNVHSPSNESVLSELLTKSKYSFSEEDAKQPHSEIPQQETSHYTAREQSEQTTEELIAEQVAPVQVVHDSNLSTVTKEDEEEVNSISSPDPTDVNDSSDPLKVQ